jgi:hypothetical protein
MRQVLLAAALVLVSVPAHAEVFERSPGGFVIRRMADVEANIPNTWQELLQPADWWNAKHSYSGDAQNLSIDPRVGGCFCEVLPAEDGAARPRPRGGVEHMRIVYIEQNRALRMSGALGPLQAEALQGTLSIVLKPNETGGTRVLWEYVVGGYMRQKPEQMAPLVDAMLGDQIGRLAARLNAPREGATVEHPATRPMLEGR